MRRIVFCSVPIGVEPKEWILLVPIGSWSGHPQGGFSIDPEDCAEIVANFRGSPRGRIVCDYEHQTQRSRQNGQPAPAAGWAVELEQRPDGVWARCNWTQAGDKAIRAEEYAYVSPVLAFDAVDKRTGQRIGTRLVSFALTNIPFLDELPAIAADELTGAPMLPTALLLALCLTEDATEEQAIARAEELGKLEKDVKDLGDGGSAAVDLRAMSEEAAVGRETLAVLGMDAGPAAVSAVRPRMANAGMVALSEHEAVVNELAGLKADQLVERAQTDGKVTAAQRDWLRTWACSDLDAATSWVDKAPKSFPGAAADRRPPKQGQSGTRELSDAEAAAARKAGVTEAEFIAARDAESA